MAATRVLVAAGLCQVNELQVGQTFTDMKGVAEPRHSVCANKGIAELLLLDYGVLERDPLGVRLSQKDSRPRPCPSGNLGSEKISMNCGACLSLFVSMSVFVFVCNRSGASYPVDI